MLDENSVQEEISFFQIETDNEVIARAMAILEDRLRKVGNIFTSPAEGKKFIALKLGEKNREIFSILWLNHRHRLIRYEELFQGTLDSCSVYPREVAKSGLKVNAAACILAHNHPSGDGEPSGADIRLTQKLKDALGMFDIRVLDHFIVGGHEITSFAERGLV